MKDISKRIVTIITLAVIAILFLSSVASCSVKIKGYKYLTYENEWGISERCYLNEVQISVCEIDSNLISVQQYYEE
jgi:hypothetical protein